MIGRIRERSAGGGAHSPGRLLSIDAMRGFNMAWIVGLTGVVLETAALFSASADRFLGEQFGHVAWNGLHFIDTVYPMFLFITGLSFPFSYAGQRARGVPTSRICLRLFRRAVTLVALGRTKRLLAVGVALGVLGLACAAAGCPVNKKLWTPSYMLVNGAIDFVLLAVFHWTIDVKGFRAWALPLTVIGSNAIAAYLLWHVVNFGLIGGFFANGLDRVLGTRYLFLAYASFGSLWLVLWFLKRKGVFFKV